jgi:hypothetical protein
MLPIDPDSALARHVEGGPELSGSLERAQDVLERYHGGNKYTILQDVFGAKADGIDPLSDWDSDNISEVLRCILGPAEIFADEYAVMTEEERASRFSDPEVARLAEVWAETAKEN